MTTNALSVRLRHHCGAALITNLFVCALDHPMALTGLAHDDLTCCRELKALFHAALGL